MAQELYTIGYSGYPDVEDFISELRKHGIQILIDVRSSPYSAYYESYNKESLTRKLRENGIYYANFARQFGARQEDSVFYKNGRLDFEEFAKSSQFLEGVRAVENSNAVIAFMCAEKDPSVCHRSILVARAFHDRGYKVLHIIPGSDSVITHTELEEKLVDEYLHKTKQNPDQIDFFAPEKSREDYIREAYQDRNDEIGFKPEDLTA